MADERLFVDTWAWLVLSNDRDPAFPEVSRIRLAADARGDTWITTDYVLDETITRLFAVTPFSSARRFIRGIFEASREGQLDIEQITRSDSARRFGSVCATRPNLAFRSLTLRVLS